MKKITYLLTFVMFSLLATSMARATVTPSSDPDATHLDGIKEGDQFFIRRAFEDGSINKWMSLVMPYVPGQEILANIQCDGAKINDEGLFQAEFTGSKFQFSEDQYADGFYLKNVLTGKYICLTTGDDQASALGLTSDLSQAVIWGTQAVAEVYPDNEFAAGRFYLFTITSTGKLWYLNAGTRWTDSAGNATAFIGTWGTYDANTWYDFIPAEEAEEDLIEKHIKLYDQASKYGNADDDGRFVIQGGIGGYDDALVQEYREAMYDNTDDLLMKEFGGQEVDWKAICQRLEALIISLQTAKFRLPETGYYYIVSAYEPWTYTGEQRAVYADGNTVFWSTFADHETEPAYMWHFIRKDSLTYSLQSVSEGLLFTQLAKSGAATMTINEDIDVTLHLLGNAQFNIQVGGTNSDTYVHPMNHQNGAGTGSTITGWPGGINSESAWRIEPIDEELYAPYVETMQQKFEEAKREADKDRIVAELQDSLIARIREISNIAKPAFEYELPDDVVDVTPLSFADFQSNSAMLDGAPAEEQFGKSWGNDGQGFGALIDGDLNTYFHTNWQSPDNIKWSAYNADGTQAEGAYETKLHNLGMKLSQPASNVTFQVSARNSAYYNNPTKINVEVSHDGINWTTVVYGYDFFTPTTKASEPYLMGPFELGDTYEYVRFANHINDREGKRFFVFSELKVFVGARLTSTCQASTMDQAIVQNFLQAYSNANKYADIVTIDQLDDLRAAFDALEAAFEAFKGAFADPTELMAAIAKGEALVDGYQVGDDMVGLYDGTVQPDVLADELDASRQMLEAGFYKQDAVNQHAERINSLIDAISATLVRPNPDIWYQFVFPSQEEFNANPDWRRSEAEMNVGESEDMSLALYDRVAAITNGTDSTFYESIEELRESATLKLQPVHEWLIEDQKDVSLFRFIPVGDDRYVIQNKATGLFMNNMGHGSQAFLTSAPDAIGSFRVTYVGKGCCIIFNGDYRTAEETAETIHFTWNQNAVCGWTDTTIGTKSSLHVRAAEAVAGDVVLRRSAEAEQAFTSALVTNVTEIEGGLAYSVQGLYLDDLDEENPQMYVGLKLIEATDGNLLKPGQPAVIVPEDDVVTFHLGTDLSKHLLTENGLHGAESNLSAGTVEPGNAVLRFNSTDYENYFQVMGGVLQYTVPACQAWLGISSPDELPMIANQNSCDLWIPIRGDLKNTAIRNLAQPINMSGTVFDLSGRRVGTSTDLQKLGRGIYVINGHKVAIK